MGEFLWYFIMAIVVGTAFLPLILKERCPTCKRRCLKQLNPLDVNDPTYELESPRFVTYFFCGDCDQYLRRERNNPMEVLPEPEADDTVVDATPAAPPAMLTGSRPS